MRLLLFLPALLLTACGGRGDVAPSVSPALAVLHLVEDHPQIPAAVFPHAEHTHVTDDGRRATCIRCHHELGDGDGDGDGRERLVPRACRDCHSFAYLTEPIDESQPHEHSQKAPDL